MAPKSATSTASLPFGPEAEESAAPQLEGGTGPPRFGPGRSLVAAPQQHAQAGTQPVAGLDLRDEVKSAVLSDVQAASKSLSHEQLADRLTGILGYRISLSHLEKLYNPTKEYKHLPAGWLAGWGEAMRSDRILAMLAERRGYELADHRQVLLAELGAVVDLQHRAKALRQRIQRELREVAA